VRGYFGHFVLNILGVLLSGERIDSNRRILAAPGEMEEDSAGEAPRGRSIQVVGSLQRRGVGKGRAAMATSYGRWELAAGDGGGN
jgi:hypothetical protein